MVEEQGPPNGDPHDARYFGPFGQSTQPAGWEVQNPPHPGAPGAVGPVFSAPAPEWAPPAAPAAEPGADAWSGRRRGPRPLAVVALAGVTALLVGGGAGYGGARLAERPATSAAPAPSSTSVEPSAGSTTTAAPLPPAPGTPNTIEVAKRASPGTVMIQVGSSTGSGFVFDAEGRIMTNNHVVAGVADGRKIRVVFANGQSQTATLVGRSPSYDIAMIKVKASGALRPLAAGNSDQTEVGQPVIAVGSPLGLPGTVTQGIVSARNRPVVVNGDGDADAPTAYINAIQTDAPINPGNSGGPLVDSEARVIGVNSAILTMGSNRTGSGNIGLGFAIPINQARVVGDQLIQKGKATYPVLGASVRTTGAGVEVTSVESSGPARKAGLRQGDLITRIDGTAVREMEELIVSIRTRRPGEVVALDYTRDSSDDQVKVTLGSRVG